MRGSCLESAVDKYFVMRNSKEFLGLIQTSMIFSSQQKRWEIVASSETTKILAYMEAPGEEGSFPLGRQSWYFLDVPCTDPGLTTRQTHLLSQFSLMSQRHGSRR